MTFEQLQSANKTLTTTEIKSKKGNSTKDYVMVNERIKAFRMLYPNGSIETDIIQFGDGTVTMKATIKDDFGAVLATGHANEKEDASFINKTSYIENCETSAVGRALGMLGIGIDTSVASFEEMENALQQQEELKPITEPQVATLEKCIPKHGQTIERVCEVFDVESLSDLNIRQFIYLMNRMGEQ